MNRQVYLLTALIFGVLTQNGCQRQSPLPPNLRASWGFNAWANGSEMQELARGFIAAEYLYDEEQPILVVLHDSLNLGVEQRGRHFPAENEYWNEFLHTLSGSAGTVKWSCRNDGDGYNTVTFNDKEYELSKGRVFLVSVRLKDLPVVQLQADGEELHLQSGKNMQDVIEDFAKQETAVSEFFRQREPVGQ